MDPRLMGLVEYYLMRDFLVGKTLTVAPECYPCFLRQTLISLDEAEAAEETRHEVVRAVLAELGRADPGKSPAHATTFMHRRIREMLGKDPFARVKSRYNTIAMGLYPGLKSMVSESHDPFLTASRLAIAGNIIDFGIFSSVDLEGAIERALGEPLAVDHSERFREEVSRAGSILYLLDNSGEIVFDRLLMEELIALGKHVTAVVKGSPVINDCTMNDAREAGIGEICDVIDNGSDAVGTILEMVSAEFRERFRGNGSLIISKGQGNFETLMGEPGNIFYLFQSKCEVLSGVLELPRGSMLLVGN
jgi:uncharacterized protein with ATP-grasp and redox domains